MKERKEEARISHFTDADLKQEADRLLICVNRDSAEFAARGYNQARKDAYIGLINEFDAIPVDSYYETLKEEKTIAKNDARSVFSGVLKTVLVMVENKYGANSIELKKLGISNMSRLSDNQMVRVTKSFTTVINGMMPDLSSEGLTQAMITDIDVKRTAFDVAIDEQQSAVMNRDLATDSRIRAGNALYAEMVKICNIGKDIWYAVNEAKYNDYVLYETHGAVSHKIIFHVELTTSLDIEISMNGMLNATAQIMFGDGSSRKMIFNGLNLVTVNHTYPSLGTYALDVSGDLLNSTEFHSNNSQLTTLSIPDDAININTYVLQNNKFTTEMVDYILTRINEFNTTGTLINLMGNAVPSAIGLAAKTALEARGWVVMVAS